MAHVDPLVDSKTASSATTGAQPHDWPATLSSAVVRAVDSIRDKTTAPALTASRYAVYFTAIALIGMVVAVLALILLVRLLVVITGYVPTVDSGESWLAYLLLGGIFLLAGRFLWRKKDR